MRSCFEIIALVIYTTFPAIFTFLIGHVATATLPLPKVKLSRKIHITNFGNHFKTASEKAGLQSKKLFVTLQSFRWGVRVVEGACLENRCTCERTGGSNPFPTAVMPYRSTCKAFFVNHVSKNVTKWPAYEP